MKKNAQVTVRDVLKDPLNMYDSMQSLPRFHSAKLFVLLDKLSNLATGLASGMVFTMDAVFAYFPGAQLDLALKHSKEYKNWHRSTEDLIDDVTDKLKDKLKELADCFEISGQKFGEGRPQEFVANSIADMYTETAGRDPKRTSESLMDLSRIIENAGFLEGGDLESSRHVTTKSFRNTVIGDDIKPQKGGAGYFQKSAFTESKLAGGRRLLDNVFDREEPVKQGGREYEEEDGQLIKNVRITKGVIGSHSKKLSDLDFLYHIVLSNRKDFVVVAGKDLPLTKWSYDSYDKEAESSESSQV